MWPLLCPPLNTDNGEANVRNTPRGPCRKLQVFTSVVDMQVVADLSATGFLIPRVVAVDYEQKVDKIGNTTKKY